MSGSWGSGRIIRMSKESHGKNTPLSEFVRKADSAQKKQVYRKVLERASERQDAVLSKHRRAVSGAGSR